MYIIKKVQKLASVLETVAAITLANVDRFSKNFHPRTRQISCNELIIKGPITPKRRQYTTL